MTENMENTEIIAKVSQFITRTFPAARKQKVAEDTDLLESGVVDSLGVLELVTFLQQEFGLTVADDDLTPENFQNVRSIATFVQTTMQFQPGSVR
jgi:acyl carrier protein